MSLHVGQDGVAGCQVPDTDAHEVLAHLRLPEQVVELRGGKIKKRSEQSERERRDRGEKVINEPGRRVQETTAGSSSSVRRCSASEGGGGGKKKEENNRTDFQTGAWTGVANTS